MPQGEEAIPKEAGRKHGGLWNATVGRGRRLSGVRGQARLAQELSEVLHRRWETPASKPRG